MNILYQKQSVISYPERKGVPNDSYTSETEQLDSSGKYAIIFAVP